MKPRPRPVLLRADNWTPPERTPWGGGTIAAWKRGLDIGAPQRTWPIVGESWELSFDPTLPSRDAAGTPLADLVAADPRAWLGPDARLAARAQSLLVKLLDAREALSVQVHPRDGDPALGAHESGKPEAWVVLAREPGAGLWLGLADGVTRDDFARALDASSSQSSQAASAAARDVRAAEADRVRPLLQFVPVEVGDTFVIEAGTVHAIGPGVTLLEPQLVRPGSTGVTYRFWDWGRLYGGRPRPLQRERSLAVTAWHAARGEAFVAAARRRPIVLPAASGVAHERAFDFHGIRLERARGAGTVTLPEREVFVALVVLAGRVALDGVHARGGETMVVPATASGGAALVLEDGADVFVVSPAPDAAAVAGVAEAPRN